MSMQALVLFPVCVARGNGSMKSAMMYECWSTWDDLSGGGGGGGSPAGGRISCRICLQDVLTPYICEFDPPPTPKNSDHKS